MKRLFLLALLMTTITVIWYFSITFVIDIYGEPTDISAAGDMFGGINALFSGLALAGVIFAVWLQTIDVKATKEHLRETIDSNTKMLEIMTLSTLIQEADAALIRYERWENSDKSKNYFEVSRKVREQLGSYRNNLESKLKHLQIMQER